MKNYLGALYRRNNLGQPCYWYIEPDKTHNRLFISHGVIGGTKMTEYITTHRDISDELRTRVNAKRKIGYKYLNELKDNNDFPVKEEDVLHYLKTYLPYNRTTSDGTLLPMLAKTFDNTNNKLFNKNQIYYGQPKINGLRCLISAEYNKEDLFKPIKLKFQSREGTYWNSLSDLEDYLLHTIEEKILIEMIENHFILDGELYLPGYSVNQINHFVKDASCKENKLLQYWCYDIAMEDSSFKCRSEWLSKSLYSFGKLNWDKEKHLTNKNRLIILNNIPIENNKGAITYRDRYIDCGFEGLIIRNINNEYQYGKRNLSMIKYKKSTDGKFKIIDIYPEGIKRNNVPLFLCQNDINSATFECHVGGSLEYQSVVLLNKELFIGKYMFVEYGERSGVNSVPFHIKHTEIIN